MINKKCLYLLCLFATAFMVFRTTFTVALGNKNPSLGLMATGNGINNGTLTFNSSHKSVVTEYGNTISSNANGTGSYLHVFTTTSSWYTSNPIQTINSISFTYTVSDLGVLNKMSLELRTSPTSGTVYSSAEILKSLGGGTKTYNSGSLNYPNAHYVAIKVESYDSSIPVNINQVIIRYTCNQ